MSLPRQSDTEITALCMDMPGQGVMISATRQKTSCYLPGSTQTKPGMIKSTTSWHRPVSFAFIRQTLPWEEYKSGPTTHKT